MPTNGKRYPYEPVELDQIGWKILEELQRDARLSWAELGRRVGLTTPAVSERVFRLEKLGVIRGFHADISLASPSKSSFASQCRDLRPWCARFSNR